MYKYVITGAAGWLGTNLLYAIFNGFEGIKDIEPLKENEKIKCLLLPHDKLMDPFASDERVEVVYGNLNSESDMTKLCSNAEGAILIHTAGIIHPHRFVKEFYEVNYHGTVNLVKTARVNKLKKAVVLSSNSPIGCNPTRDHRFTEESPYNPYMNYGKSKKLMEIKLKDLFSEEFPITLIRAPWFYGPNQPKRQLTFFEMIRDGKGPILGDGNNIRSMVYLENLAQGILLSATKIEANNDVFWIADERAYTMNEIVDTIEDVLESDFGVTCKHKRLNLPSFVSDIAFVIDLIIQKAGLYHQKFHVLSEMNKNIACDITKAKVVLGYSPKISLRDGMKNSIQEMFSK